MKDVPPPTLFKYMSLSTAKNVLSSMSLRWSSPVLFNDPFDTNFSRMYSLKSAGLNDLLADRMARMILARAEPAYKFSTPMTEVVQRTRRMFRQNKLRVPFEDLKQTIRGSSETSTQLGDVQDKPIVDRAHLALRLLCLAERPDSVLMWSHYGDCHRGLVLEIKSSLTSPLPRSTLQRVTYTDDVPRLTDQEWIDYFLGRSKPQEDRLRAMCAQKATEWRYEDEWRYIAITKREADQWYTDVPIHPVDVVGVILGSRAEGAECDDVLNLIAEKIPDADLRRMRMAEGQFGLSQIAVNKKERSATRDSGDED